MGPFIFPSHGIPELTVENQMQSNGSHGGVLRDSIGGSVGGSTINPTNMESATRDN
jgi:hypothetical protein